MTETAAVGISLPPVSWCWPLLAQDERRQLLDDLASWVGWLRGRYPIADRLPACWWRHSELVEELLALWLAWHQAYTDPSAELGAPLYFHDRALPGTLERITRWGVHCTDGHRGRPDSIYDPRPVDDADSFGAHVAAGAASARDVTAEGSESG